MDKRVVYVLIMVLVITFVFQNESGYAKDDSKTLDCSYAKVCRVIPESELSRLTQQDHFNPIYLSNGLVQYASLSNHFDMGYWYRNYDSNDGQPEVYELIPERIVIAKDSYTYIPQMGMAWYEDKLVYSQSLEYETKNKDRSVLLPKRHPRRTIRLEDIPDEPLPYMYYYYKEQENIYRTYSRDGDKMFHWLFTPSISEDKVIIHILSLNINTMIPYEIPEEIEHDNKNITRPADIDWIEGEKVILKKIILNSEKLFQEGEGNTEWNIHTIWNYRYLIEKEDGEYWFDGDKVSFSWSCYRWGHMQCNNPNLIKEGREYYVDPAINLYEMNDSDQFFDTLVLISIPPYGELKRDHLALLERRIKDGQVKIVEGVIQRGYKEKSWENPGVVAVIRLFKLDNGTYRQMNRELPPIGTKIRAYYYTAKYREKIGWNYVDNCGNETRLSDPMAIQDTETGMFWYFNMQQEWLDEGFFPESYWREKLFTNSK